MTEAARSFLWGVAPNQVSLSACWSGYVDPATLQRDQSPTTAGVAFTDCTIGGVDPRLDPSSLACPAAVTTPSTDPNRETATADQDDKASSVAVVAGSTGSDTHYPTTVTVYTCFNWKPPTCRRGLPSSLGHLVSRYSLSNQATSGRHSSAPAPAVRNSMSSLDRRRRQGQILVVFAGGLIALLAIAALVIDLGFAFMIRRAEQNAVDPGAVVAVDLHQANGDVR